MLSVSSILVTATKVLLGILFPWFSFRLDDLNGPTTEPIPSGVWLMGTLARFRKRSAFTFSRRLLQRGLQQAICQ